MANPTTQPMSIIAQVTVSASPVAPVQPTFNQGLIVGSSPRITQSERLMQVLFANWQTAMAAAGYLTTDPEYIAMGLYFSQSPNPNYGWVGLQDLTAVQTAIPHSGNAGTGYKVGDVVSVSQGSPVTGSGLQLTVSTIGGGGAVTGLTKIVGSQGTGYALGTGLAATGGSGTGLEVDITVLSETLLDAVTSCRAASFQWWGLYCCGAAAADHEAIVAAVQTMSPPAYYLGNTWDANVLTGAAGNVLSVLQTLGYGRTLMTYSTTQGGLYPANAYFGAAVMGAAMGMNSGLANSFFTLANKSLVGVAVEPLTTAEVFTIAGDPVAGTLGNGGNVYISVGNSYNFFMPGQEPGGNRFWQTLNRDMLASFMQYGIFDLLARNPAIPRTNGGQTSFLDTCNAACAQSASIGYLAGGVWGGTQVLNLKFGDPVPLGYLCQSQKYPNPKPAGHAAMPIYATVVEAGSAEAVVIAVYVTVA